MTWLSREAGARAREPATLLNKDFTSLLSGFSDFLPQFTLPRIISIETNGVPFRSFRITDDEADSGVEREFRSGVIFPVDSARKARSEEYEMRRAGSRLSARFELQAKFQELPRRARKTSARESRLGCRITLHVFRCYRRNSRASAFTLRRTLDPERFREAKLIRGGNDVARKRDDAPARW